MKFNAEQFLTDYNIPFETSGKNTSADFFQMNCPFCDDHGQHFGFHKRFGYGNCWKCGNHNLIESIVALAGLQKGFIREVLERYAGKYLETKTESKYSKASKCMLPIDSLYLGLDPSSMAYRYLQKRKFNPDAVRQEWGLLETGPTGDYKFRIIAPIYYQNRLVSYQGRDITSKAVLRYKACKVENEVLHHKHTLYGIDNIKNRRAVIVEGITDCWRLGHGSIATFGTGYTHEQVNMMVKHLDQAFICYDDQAEENAYSLANTLSGLGVDVEILTIDASDPGEMSDQEAIELMKILKEN